MYANTKNIANMYWLKEEICWNYMNKMKENYLSGQMYKEYIMKEGIDFGRVVKSMVILSEIFKNDHVICMQKIIRNSTPKLLFTIKITFNLI